MSSQYFSSIIKTNTHTHTGLFSFITLLFSSTPLLTNIFPSGFNKNKKRQKQIQIPLGSDGITIYISNTFSAAGGPSRKPIMSQSQRGSREEQREEEEEQEEVRHPVTECTLSAAIWDQILMFFFIFIRKNSIFILFVLAS